jgi:hypothetical protein
MSRSREAPQDRFGRSRRTLSRCRVTTHWQHTEELQVRFPQAKVVDNQLFVADGTIWSSGGMTVCVDVATFLDLWPVMRVLWASFLAESAAMD